MYLEVDVKLKIIIILFYQYLSNVPYLVLMTELCGLYMI